MLIILSPQLFSHGMFLDGVLYAQISKNLAHGVGTFWYPQFSVVPMDILDGQPLLAFGLQSLFFRVFGDSYLVERVYSLLTFVVAGILMYRICRFVKGSEAYTTGWMPIFLWGMIPLVFWAVTNNVLENTMMVFVLLSVLWILKSEHRRRFLYLFLSGLSLSCAFLTRGFTGLFPLSFIFWLWLFRRKMSFRSCVVYTAWLFFVAVLPYVLMFFFYEEATQSLWEIPANTSHRQHRPCRDGRPSFLYCLAFV